MKIDIKAEDGFQIVTLEGEVDANTAPKIHQEIMPLAEPGTKILVDMTEVPYMSSAGLRLLLFLYRQTTANEAKLVLVGLSEELIDTMSVTGFLEFFTIRDTLADGKAAL